MPDGTAAREGGERGLRMRPGRGLEGQYGAIRNAEAALPECVMRALAVAARWATRHRLNLLVAELLLLFGQLTSVVRTLDSLFLAGAAAVRSPQSSLMIPRSAVLPGVWSVGHPRIRRQHSEGASVKHKIVSVKPDTLWPHPQPKPPDPYRGQRGGTRSHSICIRTVQPARSPTRTP